MISDLLRSIDGIGLYPTASLVFFFVFFVVMVIYVIRMDRAHIDRMKMLPLESNENRTDIRRQIDEPL